MTHKDTCHKSMWSGYCDCKPPKSSRKKHIEESMKKTSFKKTLAIVKELNKVPITIQEKKKVAKLINNAQIKYSYKPWIDCINLANTEEIMKNYNFTVNVKPEDTVILITVSEGRLVTSLDLFHKVDDKRVKTVKVVVNRRAKK